MHAFCNKNVRIERKLDFLKSEAVGEEKKNNSLIYFGQVYFISWDSFFFPIIILPNQN